LNKAGQIKAKYEIPLELNTHLKWEVIDEIKGDKKTYTLVGFMFQ
jgi:hypothetical protein